MRKMIYKHLDPLSEYTISECYCLLLGISDIDFNNKSQIKIMNLNEKDFYYYNIFGDNNYNLKNIINDLDIYTINPQFDCDIAYEIDTN